MGNPSRFDWSGFIIHFVFGAALGTVIGLGLWAQLGGRNSTSSTVGVLCIGGGALACGLVAGFFEDRFWGSFARLFRWW